MRVTSKASKATVRRRRGLRVQRGFGLLEAIVALVILGSSGLMLFSWIGENMRAASRLRDAEVRAQLQLEGVALLETINPAREPSGEREFGSLRLRWRGELIESMRSENDVGGMLVPRWRLGLYRVHASVEGRQLKAEWTQTAVGYRSLTGNDGVPEASPW